MKESDGASRNETLLQLLDKWLCCAAVWGKQEWHATLKAAAATQSSPLLGLAPPSAGVKEHAGAEEPAEVALALQPRDSSCM